MRNWLQYHNSTILSLILVSAFLWSLLFIPWSKDQIDPGGLATALELGQAMIMPDLSMNILKIGLNAAWKTVAYATCGMTLAILLAIPLGLLASGSLQKSAIFQWISTGTFRAVLGAMRSVHELVWAWLFVAAVGLTPLAAIISIAIPYGGVLGRIIADLLNDVDEQPLTSLKASGADQWQTLLYGRIPQVLPDILSYTMFRYECSIRSAAIMSFIGLGGLGYQIEISLDDLHFAQAWTFVYILVALVFAVSLWSSELRKALLK